MKHKRIGFTLIEIAIFLAVTATLFMGIVVATQGSIWNQRYFDSVQNFAEFLRSIYSQVSNPQSVGKGNSNTAIYGKLVVFGESYNLQYEGISENDRRNYGQQIFVYDVVGDVKGTGTGNVATMLLDLHANVVIQTSDGRWAPAGEATDYIPKWGAEIETLTPGQSFTGSILVVRHPRSGTINTLFSPTVIEVNQGLASSNNPGEGLALQSLLTKVLEKTGAEAFRSEEVSFCLNPYGFGAKADNRREIRLAENARNASAVQIIDLDSVENRCQT